MINLLACETDTKDIKLSYSERKNNKIKITVSNGDQKEKTVTAIVTPSKVISESKKITPKS